MAPKVVSAVLYLCESQNRVEQAIGLIQELRATHPNHSWDERTLAVIMRLYSQANDVASATHLFGHLITSEQLKHRTVSPYLELCSRNSLLTHAGAAYVEAKKRGILLLPEDFTSLIKMCAGLGDSVATLRMFLDDAAEYLDELDEAALEHIAQWTSRSDGGGSAAAATISPLGECSICNAKLRGHNFTAAQKGALLNDVSTIVAPKTCRNPRHFETFHRFLAARGDPIDVFVDGLNVGYYGLSSWYRDAKLQLLEKKEVKFSEEDLTWDPKRGPVDVPPNLFLIDQVLRQVQAETPRCMVILPQRHTEPANITHFQEKLVAQWKRDGLIFSPPSGLLDDLCWVYGALYYTKPSDCCAASTTPVSPIARVVTNDKMRDHLFKLLSSRAFSRWRDEHQVTFKCERVDNATNFILSPPHPYSRCIQKDMATGRWHVPLKRIGSDVENVEDTQMWACVRC